MKRKHSCLLFLITAMILPAQAIKMPGQKKDPLPDFAHWSMSLKGGANYQTMPPDPIRKSDRLNALAGVTLDYTFNPFIGIALDYTYMDYSRPYVDAGTQGQLTGWTNDVLLTGSVNLTNVFNPYRKGLWEHLSVYGNLGGGVALFKAKTENLESTGSPAMMGKVGLTGELSINRTFGIYLEGEFRQYDALHMTVVKSTRNADGFMCLLGLRVKFGTKTKPQVRNVGYCQYAPNKVPVQVKEIFVKQDSKKTLDSLQRKLEENAVLYDRIAQLENFAKQKALENESALHKKIRELEEKSRQDSLRLVEQGLALKLKAAETDSILQDKFRKMEQDLLLMVSQKQGVVNLILDNIEFKTGSSILAASSYESLNRIVKILTKITSWNTLKVSGHTDSSGSDAVNKKLSQSRALSVRKYLITKGLPVAKIQSTGYGESKPIAPNTTPEGRQKNRRVEFEIK